MRNTAHQAAFGRRDSASANDDKIWLQEVNTVNQHVLGVLAVDGLAGHFGVQSGPFQESRHCHIAT
jgi:hypothetical protein